MQVKKKSGSEHNLHVAAIRKQKRIFFEKKYEFTYSNSLNVKQISPRFKA